MVQTQEKNSSLGPGRTEHHVLVPSARVGLQLHGEAQRSSSCQPPGLECFLPLLLSTGEIKEKTMQSSSATNIAFIHMEKRQSKITWRRDSVCQAPLQVGLPSCPSLQPT